MSAVPIRSVDPATETVIEEFTAMSPGRLEELLADAAVTAARWRDTPLDERVAGLRAVAAGLRDAEEHLATVITLEMGKPLAEARAEVRKCAAGFDHVAGAAAAVLAERTVESDGTHTSVVLQPLGVVLGIMPWNFPLWQVVRFLAPALAAGNVGLLKHAPNTTRSALELAAVIAGAGLPAGLLGVLVIEEATVASVIADPRVAAVTLTGSTRAGAAVAAEAGRNLKPTVLELGGSDAFIVLEDADLDAAAETAVRSRFQNCGQSCICAKRHIVVDAVADAFTERCVAAARALVQGPGTDPATTLGPMARADLRAGVETQLAASVAAGARVLTGGGRGRDRGFFHEATVLAGVAPGMPVVEEEVFGPVLPILRVPDEGAAVALANASSYGLGGNVWTRDLDRGRRIALRLDCGGVFVNGMTHSDPRLPFGGVKRSGYGRELGDSGLRAFVNEKVLWVGPAR